MIQIKLPRPDIGIEAQDDDVLFSMLLFGEARGEIDEAKIGVGWVVWNRNLHPRWWGKNLRGVILKPFQFSCLNLGDPNRTKLLFPFKHEEPQVWDRCYDIAIGIMNNEIPDNTLTSDHYFDDSILPPRWAKPSQKTVKIGKLNFYRLEI